MKQKRFKSSAFLALIVLTSSFAGICRADISLSDDWSEPVGTPLQQRQSSRLLRALQDSSLPLNAAANSRNGEKYTATPDLGFKLGFGEEKYYLKPTFFVAKNHPDEICTPRFSKSRQRLECEEGQRYTESCHLMFFNTAFEHIGLYRFHPNEPFETYCNGVVAVGVADKARDEIFATFQYFSIDKAPARSAAEIGSGWKRVTLLLRLNQSEGRISVEEDLSCIPKPNALETIPDARLALKACRANASAR